MKDLTEVIGSSYIAAYGYWEATKILTVRFQDGSVFDFAKVPMDIFTAFQKAKSKGKFFHAVIKDQYDGFCVSKPGLPPSKREDKVEVATPVFLALNRCKKDAERNPAAISYFLWAACGKPYRTGSGKNSLVYRACVELIVEASGKKEFSFTHIEKAIAIAKERRL